MNTEEDIMNEKVISVDDYIRRGLVIDAIRYRVCQGQGNKEHICKRGSCAYCGIMEIMCDISNISSSDVQPIDRRIDAQKNPPPIIDKRSATSESVLILRDNGKCAVAYYCNSTEDGDYWTTDDDKTMYCWEEVTHWQPLPESPKEEEVKIAEPKPCPFCGGKAVNCTKQYDGRVYRYRIQCDNSGCACRTPWLCYQEDATEVWNRRAENDN